MKAVLINDLKLYKTQAISFLLITIFVIIINFYLHGLTISSSLINYIFILTLIIRAEIVFSDNYSDLDKFLIMPISINEYIKSKIIKNTVVFVISSVVFAIILLSLDEMPKSLINFYFLNFLAVDFVLMTFFHILLVKFKKRFIGLLYFLLLNLIGFALMFFNLIDYRLTSVLISALVILLSLYLDYRLSKEILKEMKE
ncbi:hypothetical protein KQI68_07605 [Peptoniphilus sp. MSJ-1]|uniref:ABC-2 family transporter protein n=1 Tax=Peptoniphilus ovalis TaxID=2841503 RepID=A0ABS6FHP3_9FIRM|nr:hypothetical protein [Peptoniphilus ovalis]MBU5669697.1 hypothetical protein [Peptoniphilus ovalis]